MVNYGEKSLGKYLTPDQVAERLQVPKQKLQRWTWEGIFPAWKIGQEIRYLWPEIEAFLERTGKPDDSFYYWGEQVRTQDGQIVNPFEELIGFTRKAKKTLKCVNRLNPINCTNEPAIRYLASQVKKIELDDKFRVESIEVLEPTYAIKNFLGGCRLRLLYNFSRRFGEKRLACFLVNPRGVLPWCGSDFVIKDDNKVLFGSEDGRNIYKSEDKNCVRRYLDYYQNIKEQSCRISDSFSQSTFRRWFKLPQFKVPLEYAVELIGTKLV